MVVSTKDGAYKSLMNFVGKTKLPIVYESASKTYELTGFIVSSDGIQNDSTRDKTSAFELHSSDGPIREG